MSLDVLIVEDELDIAELIAEVLKDAGFSARIASCSKTAFAAVRAKVPNAIILDVWLRGSELDGLGILEVIKEHYSLLPVVVISGHGTLETAISAIKLGAYDYITKPLSQKKLLITLKRACETAKLKRENRELKSSFRAEDELIGKSSVITKLKAEIAKAALGDKRVMIKGGFGSEFDAVASLLHSKSARAANAMLIVNCSSAKAGKELFGSDPNASGPISRKIGKLEAANGGSIYLQNVSCLDKSLQKRLLEFLYLGKINSANESFDVRIIASASTNIDSLIESGCFSRELYERLSVCQIQIPLLRERTEDIEELVEHHSLQISNSGAARNASFSKEAIELLSYHSWPANLKQLKNVVEHSLLIASAFEESKVGENVIREVFGPLSTNLPFDIGKMSFKEAKREFERMYLDFHISRLCGNISKVADSIGMERSALHRKVKALSDSK